MPAVTRRDFIKHQAAIALRIISHNNHKEVKKNEVNSFGNDIMPNGNDRTFRR